MSFCLVLFFICPLWKVTCRVEISKANHSLCESPAWTQKNTSIVTYYLLSRNKSVWTNKNKVYWTVTSLYFYFLFIKACRRYAALCMHLVPAREAWTGLGMWQYTGLQRPLVHRPLREHFWSADYGWCHVIREGSICSWPCFAHSHCSCRVQRSAEAMCIPSFKPNRTTSEKRKFCCLAETTILRPTEAARNIRT